MDTFYAYCRSMNTQRDRYRVDREDRRDIALPEMKNPKWNILDQGCFPTVES